MNASEGTFVVVDPTEMRPDAFHSLFAKVKETGARLLLYGRLTSQFAAQVAWASSAMRVETAIASEQGRRNLLRLLRDPRATASMHAIVLHRIADHIRRTHACLLTAFVGLFAGLPVPARSCDLLQQMNMSAARTHRCLLHAGLAPLPLMLCGIRLCHSWPSLCDRSLTLEAIAEKYGFGAVRTLHDNCVRFTGVTPGRVHRVLDNEEFASRVLRVLQPHTAQLN
ncbi:MAG: hypothetical protein HOP28_01385 [Gemmatimonadales bacterium]|nr:hypothetical protein [Gemmatimonadales bacterium]